MNPFKPWRCAKQSFAVCGGHGTWGSCSPGQPPPAGTFSASATFLTPVAIVLVKGRGTPAHQRRGWFEALAAGVMALPKSRR
jgi:hypothetical protein